MISVEENRIGARKRVAELRRQLSCQTALFPSTGAGAYCSFRSQTIHLLETRSTSFKASVKERNFCPIREDIATVFHEMTHWCDCLGTTWGQGHLVQVFAAYDVVLNKMPETEYWTVVSLYDAERRINRAQ